MCASAQQAENDPATDGPFASYAYSLMQPVYRLSELVDNQPGHPVNDIPMLLQKGLAVEDIIPQRQINTSTVYSHLAKASLSACWMCAGLWRRTKPGSNAWCKSSNNLGEEAIGGLNPVYAALEGEYDYGTLKCMQASLVAYKRFRGKTCPEAMPGRGAR